LGSRVSIEINFFLQVHFKCQQFDNCSHCVNDTGGKFAACIVDTVGKFAGGKLIHETKTRSKKSRDPVPLNNKFTLDLQIGCIGLGNRGLRFLILQISRLHLLYFQGLALDCLSLRGRLHRMTNKENDIFYFTLLFREKKKSKKDNSFLSSALAELLQPLSELIAALPSPLPAAQMKTD
jgi:hypothetical protein